MDALGMRAACAANGEKHSAHTITQSRDEQIQLRRSDLHSNHVRNLYGDILYQWILLVAWCK